MRGGREPLSGLAGDSGPERLAALLCVIVVTIASVDLLGWAFHIPVLVTFSANFATMKPNTALCVMMQAYAVASDVAQGRKHRWVRWAARCMSGLALLTSALSLGEYITRRDFGIDGLLIAVPADRFGDSAGRMALGTAVTIILTALAFLERDRFSRSGRVLLFAGGVLSASGLVGFLLGAGPLTGVPWMKSVAVKTALTLLMLQVSILCTRPEREPFRSLTRFRTSYVHRGHLLFAVTVMPVLLGIPVMMGVRRGWYDAAFALSLLLVLLVGMQTYLLWSANVAIDKAAAALMQSEKLAAVGRLASSIAHEINNPLESVTNLLYLTRMGKLTPEAHHYIEQAEMELRRVSAIANQTLRFHKQATRPRPVLPAELLESVLSIFHAKVLNSGVSVEQRIRTNDPVLCFDGEIRQVLSNLLGNAIDAMHPMGGGRLLIRTHRTRLPEDGMVFVVADSGPGISGSTQSKMFEPFFTTKGKNGTGLGLWISQEIVERHGGTLRVRTTQRAGRAGTTFALFLPRVPVERNAHAE
jgi:signal transduction histidine kinase